MFLGVKIEFPKSPAEQAPCFMTFCPKFCRGLSRPTEIFFFSSCLSLLLSANEESLCLDSPLLGKNHWTGMAVSLRLWQPQYEEAKNWPGRELLVCKQQAITWESKDLKTGEPYCPWRVPMDGQRAADIVACSRQAWADIVSPRFYTDVELWVSIMEHYL